MTRDYMAEARAERERREAAGEKPIASANKLRRGDRLVGGRARALKAALAADNHKVRRRVASQHPLDVPLPATIKYRALRSGCVAGEAHHQVEHSDAVVAEARRLCAEGMLPSDAARLLGVKPATLKAWNSLRRRKPKVMVPKIVLGVLK